jgi:hypothetical protein
MGILVHTCVLREGCPPRGRGNLADDPDDLEETLRDHDLDPEETLSPEEELAELLPDDIDPHEMADSIEDELIAEEGAEFGLDPDLAVYAAEEGAEEDPFA